MAVFIDRERSTDLSLMIADPHTLETIRIHD